MQRGEPNNAKRMEKREEENNAKRIVM